MHWTTAFPSHSPPFAFLSVVLLACLLMTATCSQELTTQVSSCVLLDDDTLFVSSSHSNRIELYARSNGLWNLEASSAPEFDNIGRVYVYTRTTTSFGLPYETISAADLSASGLKTQDFGYSIAIAGAVISVASRPFNATDNNYHLAYYTFIHSPTNGWVESLSEVSRVSNYDGAVNLLIADSHDRWATRGVAVDSEIIATASLVENEPIVLDVFDVKGSHMSTTEVSISGYNLQLSMTAEHILLTSYKTDTSEHSGIIMVYARTTPAKLTLLGQAELTASHDGVSGKFAATPSASFEATGSAVSTFAVGDAEASSDGLTANGCLFVVTVDPTTTPVLGGNVAVDDQYLYASAVTETGIGQVVVLTHALAQFTAISPGWVKSLASDGMHLVVGSASSNMPHLDIYDTSSFEKQAELTPFYPNPEDVRDHYIGNFGNIAFCGNRLAVASSEQNMVHPDSGVTYTYQLIDSEWIAESRTPGPCPLASSGLSELACSGDLVVATQMTSNQRGNVPAQVITVPQCAAGTNGSDPACAPCAAGSYSSFAGSICLPASPCFFAAGEGATAQVACPAGHYQPYISQPSCIEAHAGFYVAPTDHTQQIPCSAGTYSSAGSSACSTADPGNYVPDSDRSSQYPCNVGTYQPDSGQTSCKEADAGYYVPFTGQNKQLSCNYGTYQPARGSSACIEADPGYHVPLPASTAQTVCCGGRYQPRSGQIYCVDADNGYYVPNDARPHVAELVCDGGHYSPFTVASTCEYCPKETSTPNDGLPHESCDRWIPATPVIDQTRALVIKSSILNDTVASATFAGESTPCQLIQTAGQTTVVPVVTESTVKAGKYPATFSFRSRIYQTTVAVDIPDDLKIPSPVTTIAGNVVTSQVNSTICPDSIRVSLLGTVSHTLAAINADGSISCTATLIAEAPRINAFLQPKMTQTPSTACTQLAGVAFSSVESMDISAAGVSLAPYIDDDGRLCANTSAAHAAVKAGTDKKEEDGLDYVTVRLDGQAFVHEPMDNFNPTPDHPGRSAAESALLFLSCILLLGAFVITVGAVALILSGLVAIFLVAGYVLHTKSRSGAVAKAEYELLD
ncbi:mastigoneme-like protein [Carpediemonas membranifera]|uniref:Mastigoneme-like protein n=1 Tax=Carpediemonas membranifera TaxID=201153 RepID=A0A8J6AZE1_9EUKA|nr:mastigoneme-like protein [Carpediemonas membranifera]|eukprot:KAG9392118.1 mastigoneme-like protein [Carpediemonas membranifera]